MLGWEFPPRQAGGLGTACRGLARGLARNGVEVLFLVPRGEDREEARGVRLRGCDGPGESGGVLRLPVPTPLLPYLDAPPWTIRAAAASRGPHYGPGLFEEVERFTRAASDLAAREEFDLVHGHDWMTFPAAESAARERGAPLVVHFHSCEHDRSGPGADPRICAVEQGGLDAADAAICVSRFAAGRVLGHFHADPRKVRVVHNAAPDVRPRPVRRLSRRRGGPLVLFLGRVTFQKGPGFFLEAARIVARAEPRARFVVAGTGDLLPAMVERAAALGLARRVRFAGFLGPRAVARLLGEATVLAMPSVSEPFGLAAVEAAARGVPVVLSRQSGAAEVLPSSLRADSWDVEDLAGKILSVLHGPALRRRLAEAGRREARRLRWSDQAAAVRDLYEELLR